MANNQIRAIDGASVGKICSGQAILDLATAVKELVENALDAGATSIEVRLKEHGLQLIEVADNGKGVEPKDYEALALKYHTSKLSAFSELESLHTFGFRGEALSSLAALSELSVITRTADQSAATRLEYGKTGKLIANTACARAVGTTVAVKELFGSLPVRRQDLVKNVRREVAKLRLLLQQYAVMVGEAQVYASDQAGRTPRVVLVSTSNAGSGLLERVSAVLGAKAASLLQPLEFELPEDGIKVAGLVSKAGCGVKGDKLRQFCCINRRPVELPRGVKTLNDTYKSLYSSLVGLRPLAFLHFELPPGTFDVNVTPDKRSVFIQNEIAIMNALAQALQALWEPSRYRYTLNTAGEMLELQRASQAPTALADVDADAAATQGSIKRSRRSSASLSALEADVSQDDCEDANGADIVAAEMTSRASLAAGRGSHASTLSNSSRAAAASAATASSAAASAAAGPPSLASFSLMNGFQPASSTQLPAGIAAIAGAAAPATGALGLAAFQLGSNSLQRGSSVTLSIGAAAVPLGNDSPIAGEAGPSARHNALSPAAGSILKRPHPSEDTSPGKVARPKLDDKISQQTAGLGVAAEATAAAAAAAASLKAENTGDAQQLGTLMYSSSYRDRMLQAQPAQWEDSVTPAAYSMAPASDKQTPLRPVAVNTQLPGAVGTAQGGAACKQTPLMAYGFQTKHKAASGQQQQQLQQSQVHCQQAEQQQQQQQRQAADRLIGSMGAANLVMVNGQLEPQAPPRQPLPEGRQHLHQHSAAQEQQQQQRSDILQQMQQQQDMCYDAMAQGLHQTSQQQQQPAADAASVVLQYSMQQLMADTALRVQQMQQSSGQLGQGADAGAAGAGRFKLAAASLQDCATDYADPLRAATAIAGQEATTTCAAPAAEPSDAGDDAATAELARLFDKPDFVCMIPLGQFNLGFIIARLHNDLFIVDQHAADEKSNYERLLSSYTVNKQPLLQPRRMTSLTPMDQQVIRDNIELFRRNGFEFVEAQQQQQRAAAIKAWPSCAGQPPQQQQDQDQQQHHHPAGLNLHGCLNGSQEPQTATLLGSDAAATAAEHNDGDACDSEGVGELLLSAVPLVRGSNVAGGVLGEEVLLELLDLLAAGDRRPQDMRPKRVRDMLASRACRSSIMIGSPLSLQQQRRILARLAELDAPWNCPHGRPTMRHLAVLPSRRTPQPG